MRSGRLRRIAAGMALVLCLTSFTACKKKEKTETKTFTGIPIPVTYNPDEIAEDAARQVVSFYYSIQNNDPSLYKSLLCNEFLAYSELYWKQNGYTVEQLMQTYYDQTAEYVNKETFTITDCTIKEILRDDDTTAAIDALNDISEKLWQKKASAYYDTYFSAVCDFTVKSTQSDATYVKADSVLYVVQSDGKYLLAVF